MKLNLFATCLCAALVSGFLWADETPLIVSYGAHNSEPYAVLEVNQLVGGIIKEITDELADELDVDLVYVQTPRKRIERYLDTGTVHLVLISNPEWLTQGKQYQWSMPIFQDQDILVVKNNNLKQLEKVEDLKGMNLGTNRGYVYPAIEPMFAKGEVSRSDVRSITSNIARLELDRIDGFIDSKVLIHYEMQRKTHELQLTELVVSEHNIHAALSHHAPITIEALNEALAQLQSRGVIEAVLSRYSPH
ncbi:ABC transporter substrate-binding protein [Shewanella sp. UCD-KL12]|uniref:substrate-binding periplasmic protein n=1 Tax=Shewanella sp. UCD-KL12 TaxID=1917163 RepID=UPI0009703461|nr:transporter substrate-binding domain-containing protein [Shewanella sp. UCD-KL12]